MKTETRHRIHRASLYIFILSTCAVLVGIEYFSIKTERQAILDHTESNVLNLAASLAQHAADTLSIADTTLRPLVELMEKPKPINQENLHTLLVNQAARSERIEGIFIYDAEGNWLNSSHPGIHEVHNNSHREYFIHHQNTRSKLPFIGQPVHSLSDGNRVITISRRYNQPDGSFGGVVLISIQMKYFELFYQGFDVGNQGTIELVREDGCIMIQAPGNELTPQKGITYKADFNDLKQKEKRNFTYTSDTDHITRITAIVPTPHYPLYVVTGIARKEALSNLRPAVISSIIGTSIGILLLLAVGILLDRQLTRVLRKEIQLQSEAEMDGLTQIANRRTFDRHLAAIFHEAPSHPRSLSLLLIDVDHFKRYNDTYGHLGGDECLQKVAQALKSVKKRPNDLIARYGGEEFAILLPDCDQPSAQTIAEEAVLLIRKLSIAHASSLTRDIVTISVGLSTTVIPSETTPEELIKRADEALYRAKETGRDRVSV